MLTYVQVVPPVHGRLIQQSAASPSWLLILSAISDWFDSSFRSYSSVNCKTVQSFEDLRDVSLSFEVGWQHTSTISLWDPDDFEAAGPPVQSASAAVAALAVSGGVFAFRIDSSFTAKFHFSALTKGLVKMSAACIMLGPWTIRYHLRLNCSDSHDKFTLCVLSEWRNVGDLPFSRMRIVAWLSSMKTPCIDFGAIRLIIPSPSLSFPMKSQSVNASLISDASTL